jgi:AraC-like DNA-binding protein/ligand-binding sensor protein
MNCTSNSTNKKTSFQNTNLFLHKAHKLLSAYGRSTGTVVCVLDKDYQEFPESYNEIDPQKNMCLFCRKNKAQDMVNKFLDQSIHPCNEMHISSIKESHRGGGTFIYMCDLGFAFWTSPLFFEGSFTGALVGSGFLGIDSRETIAQMYLLGQGSVAEPELRKMIARFPRGNSEKIRALADLLLICAESLSTGKGEYHRALRRRDEYQESISLKIMELKNKSPPGSSGPAYPLDTERALLSCIRKGDIESSRQILDDLLAVLLFSNSDQYKDLQFRAIELAVLVSRTVISPSADTRNLMEINDKFISQLQTANNTEDLAAALHAAVDYYTGRVSSFQGIQHASVIKKGEWYISKNFTRRISLQDIAGASGLSAPYFSAIFKEEVGESVFSYLNRLRVERASELLSTTDFPLGKIAKDSGFDDQSWFSKTFKTYTGMSPHRYRNRNKSSASETENIIFSEKYRSFVNQ